jgi:Peptidase family C25
VKSNPGRILSAFLLFALTVRSGDAAEPSGGPDVSNKPGFIVVAPQQFHEALQDYIAHKRKQFPTTLVALETVLRENPGVDDAERLKRFLFAEWNERHVGYVLLVGDADVLPVRYMVLDRITPAAFDYAFYPSDLYYSDLATRDGRFEDWNARQESFHAGYFGEVRGEKNKDDPINYDEVDYLPDIAVGRWPVSTPEEVQIVASKTIAFETGLQTGSKTGMRRTGLFSVGGWVDSRPVLDSVADSLPPAWSIERRFYADARRNDETPPPDWDELCRLLNDGVGVVFHAGHGTDTSWYDCFPLAGLRDLHNADRLPIMISAGCSTARLAALPPYEAYVDVNGHEHKGTDHGEVFESPPPPPACYQTGRFNTTGLGERLLRGGPDGAVAYIGCNTGSQPCALTLLKGMAVELGDAGHRRLGDCWSGAIAYYFREERLADLAPTSDWYPPSIFFQGMKFMLFGDPTLLLPDVEM